MGAVGELVRLGTAAEGSKDIGLEGAEFQAL